MAPINLFESYIKRQVSLQLFEAVEKGLLPLADSLQQRAQKLKARREKILLEMAALKRQQAMLLNVIHPKKLDVFAKAMRKILLERRGATDKACLRLLVSEICTKRNQTEISGSYAALASAVLETRMDTELPIVSGSPIWSY